ncbi:lipopolysaccharide assembly protein LapA domain-containing protein [Enterococcus sp. LJL120]
MERVKEFLTIKRIIGIVVSLFVIVFAFQNWTPVTIDFIFFSVRCPLLVLILILFILGIAIGWLMKRKDVKTAAKARK